MSAWLIRSVFVGLSVGLHIVVTGNICDIKDVSNIVNRNSNWLVLLVRNE